MAKDQVFKGGMNNEEAIDDAIQHLMKGASLWLCPGVVSFKDGNSVFSTNETECLAPFSIHLSMFDIVEEAPSDRDDRDVYLSLSNKVPFVFEVTEPVDKVPNSLVLCKTRDGRSPIIVDPSSCLILEDLFSQDNEENALQYEIGSYVLNGHV